MKKHSIFLVASGVLFGLSSCDKPETQRNSEPLVENPADTGYYDTSDPSRLDEQLAALEVERATLEEDRQTWLAEREQNVADRADEVAARAFELEERQAVIDAKAAELTTLENTLELREQQLTDAELEVAGSGEITSFTPLEQPVEMIRGPVADYSTFYNDLSPHGNWFDSVDYGYIYQPTVAMRDRNWRPYTHGRWVCTDSGWTWVSEEPFGWACYHYGRWVELGNHGWCWVPGDQWAPSWVAWRETDDHVGWAPLPPESLYVEEATWGPSIDQDFGIAPTTFVFVLNEFLGGSVRDHCLDRRQSDVLYRRSKGCTNYRVRRDHVVAGGPRYDRLRRSVRTPWPVCRVNKDRMPASGHGYNPRFDGNVINVFAPNFSAPWNPTLKPRNVRERFNRVQPVRSKNGVTRERMVHYNETRQRELRDAKDWSERQKTDGLDRGRIIEDNRRKAAVAEQERAAKIHQTSRKSITPGRGREDVKNRENRVHRVGDRREQGQLTGVEHANRGQADRERAQQVEKQRDETNKHEQAQRQQAELAKRQQIERERSQQAENQHNETAKRERDQRNGVEEARRGQAERERAQQVEKQRDETNKHEQAQRQQAELEMRQQIERERGQQAENQRNDAAKRERGQRNGVEEAKRGQADRERAQQVEKQRDEINKREQAQRQQAKLEKRQQIERERAQQVERQRNETAKRERGQRNEVDEARRGQADRERAQQVEKQREQEQRQQAEQMNRQRADQAQRNQAERVKQQQAEAAQRQQAEQVNRQRAEQAKRQQAERAKQQQAEQAKRQRADQAKRQQDEEQSKRDAMRRRDTKKQEERQKDRESKSGNGRGRR